jgi:hypothetical protein
MMYKILQNIRMYVHTNMAALVTFDKLFRHITMRLLICRLPLQVAQRNVLLRSLLVTINVYFFASLNLH